MSDDRKVVQFRPRDGSPNAIAADPVDIGFNNIGIALKMRGWLQAACEGAGGHVISAGFGGGSIDLDVEIDGKCYNIAIKANG